MIHIKIPWGAKHILQQLNEHGFESYVVGGCVRDAILGKSPHDWDITTDATPEQVHEVLKNNIIYDTGIKHGTVTVLSCDELPYEVTTFRIDGTYSDNRHPDEVKFVKSVQLDLSRRDFTINAMAYSPATGLIDPFNGSRDLSAGIISAVGNPNDRFQEDGIRILRALRFASTYQFNIDAATAQAIHSNVNLLQIQSAERIQAELVKILLGAGCLNILLQYPDVFTTIIPELKPCLDFQQNSIWHCYNVYDHIAHSVDSYHGNDPIVKMALLFHDIGKPHCYTEDDRGGHFHGHGVISYDITATVLKRLKFSNEMQDAILPLVLHHDARIEPSRNVVNRWLNKIGDIGLQRLMDIREADVLAQSEYQREERLIKVQKIRALEQQAILDSQCFQLKDLNINGHILMEHLHLQPGKTIGLLLNNLLNAVMDGEVENEEQALLDKAKQLLS